MATLAVNPKEKWIGKHVERAASELLRLVKNWREVYKFLKNKFIFMKKKSEQNIYTVFGHKIFPR